MDFVTSYLRLEDRSVKAETQAEQYRQRADHDRWEQCRIVHEAVESGEHSRRSFAKAVGKSASTIERQFTAWAEWGASAPDARPSFGELRGDDSIANRKAQLATGRVRSLPPADRAKFAAELVEDPDVVQAMASDPPTRRAVSRAADEAAVASVPDPNYQRPRSTGGVAGALGDIADELGIQQLIRKARFAIRDAIGLADGHTFDEDAQSLMLEDLVRLRAGVDFLESAITSGEGDFDAALAELTGGEE